MMLYLTHLTSAREKLINVFFETKKIEIQDEKLEDYSLMYTILLHIMIYSHFLSKTTLNLILEATHAIILKFDQ